MDSGDFGNVSYQVSGTNSRYVSECLNASNNNNSFNKLLAQYTPAAQLFSLKQYINIRSILESVKLF